MNVQHEDIIWKSIFELLKDDGLQFFGITDKIVSSVNTEKIKVNIHKKIDDNLYLMDRDYFIHLEFQSTKTEISRFLVSDAISFEALGKKIRTIVIYTADIENAENCLDFGLWTYRVENFYMHQFDGDTNYQNIRAKIENKESLTKQDLMSLVLLPLMKHTVDTPTMIEQSIDLSQKLEKSHEQKQIQALLYLFAEKFVTDKDKLQKMKGVFAMTALGQMLVDDGRREGKLMIALKLLNRGYDPKQVAEDTDLDIETIEQLRKELAKQ